MADKKLYDEGLRPKILINWDTFEEWGISSSWKAPFTDAVINAYTRWMNLAGVDLRFQFWGYTTKTSSDSGELVIKMNEKFGERLASTFGGHNRLELVFHRKRSSDLTPWNFVPYNADPGEFDMQAILIHELGHCLGLDHTASGSPTVMSGYSYFARFGPFSSDVNDERAVYADFNQNRLRQQRSINSGASWAEVSNNLTTHGNAEARTNLNPGVVATPRSGFYVVGWSRVGSRAPSWLRGDGNVFLKRHWLFYGGERSIYGPVFAHDAEQTMLWASVLNDDLGTIKIVRSTNQAYQWSFVGSPTNAKTHGTPGLCWTRVNGQSTWIVLWAHYDRSNRADTGYIRASISTNNGATWSTPIVLDTFYKALSGVSAASSANNQVVVAFAWAPHSTYGMNRIRALNCAVSGSDLQRVSTVFSSETTRIQPALLYDPSADKFIVAWRGQDFNTTLNSMSKSPTATEWSGKVTLSGVRSHVAPALAYSPEYGESVLWYAYEGS